MIGGLFNLVRPLVHRIDAETAHRLTIAALASFLGGTIGAILLMIFAPILSSVAKLFWSSEYFALMVLGLTAIAAFAGKGKVLKAMLMSILGVMLATVGESALHNASRFTMGIMDLQSGIYFVTLVMGLFALPEALFLIMDRKRSERGQNQNEIKDLRISMDEAKDLAPVVGRQSVLGFLVGVLPGAGATMASFLAYAIERNLAPKSIRDKFGKGALRGLAAPETANNAACTGSFVPMLTLGIPGSGTTAILLGALVALSVTPGPRLIEDQPELFWAVIVSMYIGNLVLLVLNLPLIPYIAKLLTVPRTYLIPFVMFFSLIGAYIGQNNPTELFIMIGLGVFATVLRFGGYPLPPLIIGFILGGMLEDNLGRAMRKSGGIEFLWERPMTMGILLLAVLLFCYPFYKDYRAKKQAA